MNGSKVLGEARLAARLVRRVSSGNSSTSGTSSLKSFLSSSSQAVGYGTLSNVSDISFRQPINSSESGAKVLGYGQERHYALASAAVSSMMQGMTVGVANVVPPPSKVSDEELAKRKAKLKLTTLGDIVLSAKKRRKPDNKKLNTDMFKNYFVTAINEDANIRETVDFMLDRQVGSLFVVDGQYNVKGFVTEHSIVFSDLLLPSKTRGESEPTYADVLEALSVSDVMKDFSDLKWAEMSSTVLDAFSKMSTCNFRHLPVVQDDIKAADLEKGTVKELNIEHVAHIVSVKGLIATVYRDLLGMDDDQLERAVAKPSASRIKGKQEPDEQLAALIEVEEEISAKLGLPTVKEVLKRKAESDGKYKIINTDVNDDINVATAIREMREHKVGYVCVMDFNKDNEHAKLLGIVTEGDVMSRVVKEGRDPAKVLVKDIMTKGKGTDKYLYSLNSSQCLLTAMRLMSEFDVRHLPVTTKGSGKVTGIITSKDIVTAISAHKEKLLG